MKIITKMPVIQIPVSKGQTMSDIEELYPLPTNGIFHKILPGLGATHGEINSPRHSIIVLPNVPVIKSKVAKHNSTEGNLPTKRILAVHKGVTIDDIVVYLSDDTIVHKKILTTPEGYKDKVRKATEEVFDYIKEAYYLLIDECERTIQDVDFREKITAPFDDLFSFKNKGLISATTLPFSDPRFEEEFTHYVIKPDWDYCKSLDLIHTNNVVAALRSKLKSVNEYPCFIFLSSIKTITAIIEALSIKDESKVYCSENRRTELKVRGLKVDSDLNTDELAKYNFLTSRFYSAVDIELSYKPDVIMVTEVLFAEHSILDPYTEVIQITGRFRTGTSTLTHITNTNPDLIVKTEVELRTYLEGQRDVYTQLLKLKSSLNNDGAKDAFKEIEKAEFVKFFKSDGNYNWFIVDNAIQQERVLGLYQNIANLFGAYQQKSDHFNVTLTEVEYPLSDTDRLKRESTESRKDFVKEVVKQIKQLTTTSTNFVIDGMEEKNALGKLVPGILKAYHTIGEDGIKEAGYLESRINQAVKKIERAERLTSKAFVRSVYQNLSIGDKPLTSDIINALQAAYDQHDIQAKARAEHIKKYFDADRTTVGENQKCYVLKEPVYPEIYFMVKRKAD